MKNTKTINCLICFISGAALGLSLPAYGFWILSWISIIPLIMLINQTKTFIKSLLYSYFFGFGLNLVSLSFLISLHPIHYHGFTATKSLMFIVAGWLFQSAYCALLVAIFGLILFYVSKCKINSLFKSLLSAFIWTVVTHKLLFLDYIYMVFSSIEFSQYLNLPLIQFCQYIGGVGICFIIVLFNSFIAFNLNDYINKKSNRKTTAIKALSAICVLGIIHLAGFILLNLPDKYYKSATVTLLQNTGTQTINKYYEEKYFELIKKSHSDIVFTPEETFIASVKHNKAKIYDKLNEIAKKQNKIIVIGALENIIEKKLSLSSAVVIDGKTSYSVEKNYHKQHFIPIFEYVFSPHEKLFASIFNIKPRVKNIIPGKGYKVIKAGNFSIAPSICSDLFFPEYIKVQKKDNADMLVNLSGLIWFHNNDMSRWYNAIAVIRAAETRRPFISCMNTGSSIIVDHKGRILTLAPANTFNNVTKKVYFIKDKSFYSRISLF